MKCKTVFLFVTVKVKLKKEYFLEVDNLFLVLLYVNWSIFLFIYALRLLTIYVVIVVVVVVSLHSSSVNDDRFIIETVTLHQHNHKPFEYLRLCMQMSDIYLTLYAYMP